MDFLKQNFFWIFPTVVTILFWLIMEPTGYWQNVFHMLISVPVWVASCVVACLIQEAMEE